jgi:hydrogenase nickel incorporation protein HypB
MTCGCGETGHNDRVTIAVRQNLLEENDRIAAHNRQHFAENRVLVLNLMSAPGSGKTSLLEATIRALLARGRKVAVIEGDLETENDAERIRRQGVPAVQITTGSACHLDARMVHHALDQVPLAGLDVLFVENVGNLVCPAEFDLGQHGNVVLLSVTEGDDKPEKYPVMFRIADHVLISKADLLPVLDDFDPNRARRAVEALAPGTPVSLVSAKTGEGMDAWIAWIEDRVAELPAAAAPGERHRHDHDPGHVHHHHDR